MKKPFWMGIALACTFAVFAESPEQRLALAAQAVPNRLISEGITIIGDLSLKNLARRMKKTLISIRDGAGWAQGNFEERHSANYYGPIWTYRGPTQPEILLRRSLVADYSEQEVSEFLVHEHLGASGFYDQHYALSAFLVALARSEGAHRDALLRGSLESAFEKSGIWVARKGGSGVGGGGEIFPFLIKTRVYLDLYSDGAPTVADERIELLPELQIEMSEERFSAQTAAPLKPDGECPPAAGFYVYVPGSKAIFFNRAYETLGLGREETRAKIVECAARAILEAIR